MSWHSSVDIAIGSELDGPEIESRWDEILRTRSDRRQGPPGGGLNGLGLNGLGGGVDHPPPSRAEVKGKV